MFEDVCVVCSVAKLEHDWFLVVRCALCLPVKHVNHLGDIAVRGYESVTF